MKQIKKIVFCIITFLLVTGCSAEYHLSFQNGKIEEMITWQTDSLQSITESDGRISDIEKTDYFAYEEQNENTKYDKVITKHNNKYQIELHYEHDPDSFEQSIVLQNFKNHIFINDADYYYIHLKDGLINGMENIIEDTIKIHITTDNRVIAENADDIKGHTYTWNITKQNASQKEIFFQVSKQEKEFIDKDGNLVVTGMIVILLLIVLPVAIWGIGQKVLDKIETK